ncbi:MAG: hypothetical protein JXB05_07030 [Myxococcaceae bacterium]|nr:hypothetical protein [Myxococcaceae bacterium]
MSKIDGSKDKSKSHSTHKSEEKKPAEKKPEVEKTGGNTSSIQNQNKAKGFSSESTFTADAGKAPVELSESQPVGETQAPINQEALEAAYDSVVTTVNEVLHPEPPAEPAGATEVFETAVTAALETLKEQYPDMPPEEMMDYAMAAAGAALVGNSPDLMGKLRLVDGSSRLVQLMEALPPNAGMGQDLAAPTDLNPAFNDGTPNQAFHCGFFILAGYASQGDPTKVGIARAGNLAHELFEGGSSVADFLASEASIQLGAALYKMGQTNDWNVVKQAPALIQGVLGNGEPAPYQIAGETVDATELSRNARQLTEEVISEVRDMGVTAMVSAVETFQDNVLAPIGPAIERFLTPILTPVARWFIQG